MKNKRGPGSLFALLVRSYLLFTVALLTIAAGLFGLWNAWLVRSYPFTDWDGLLADRALAGGDYSALSRYLKGEGSFAVYDPEGRMLYATADDFDAFCPPETLACVPRYGEGDEVHMFPMTDAGGQQRYLLLRIHGDEEGGVAFTDTALLDDELWVIFGGLDDGKDRYTWEEYAYLSGSRFPNESVYRVTVQDRQGLERTLLLREGPINGDLYSAQYEKAQWVWLLSVPLYLAVAGLFIIWLSRKIGRPLRRLNEAVEAQMEGRVVHVGDCGGAQEIRRIGESFDRLSESLLKSEAERRRLDQGRQKLIADISHDLKTPITVISGYVDAICDGKIPQEEQERYLRAIKAKADTLTELVNAFHEYSKVEHPEFVLHPERTDLCEFLREYLAGKYDEIDLAGFSLEIEIPERAMFCRLDQLQFRRVLDNLISNALRHNRLGTALRFQVTEENGCARLIMADNGAGIPPERAKRIFEPFVVGSEARSSGKGSGLGLAITRRIMEKHGGTIVLSARPTPGWSTEFILTLPLERGGT